jgi:hypothetical protein
MGDLPTHTHTSCGLFSWATCPSILKMVYFQGRPAHTLTLVYFHGWPAHTRSHWFIFMGDLPNYKKEEWSYCNGWPTQVKEWSHCNGWPTQIKTWRIGRIVMGDLPRNGKQEEWSCCNGWPTQVEEWSHCNGWPTQITTWRMVEL